MHEIPENWEWTTLGEVFKWGSGGTPKSSNPAFYDGDIPWLIIRDLDDAPVSDSLTKITEDGLKNSSAKWVEPGSVLVAMYGSIGKLGLATDRLTTNQAIAFTQPEPNDAKYLFYYLMLSRSALHRQGKGIAQKNISQTVLKAFPFPLAPLEQQKRIVAKIEELFSHVDAGIEALNKAKQLLKQYRQSVLKAAVTGELTKEWREQNKDKLEPASQLLERILQERRQKWEEQQLEQFKAKGKMPKDDKWKGKYKELENIDNEALERLPNSWIWVKNEQVGSIQLGRQRAPKYHNGPNMRPYLRVQNVFEDKIDLNDVMEMEFSESDYEKYVLKYNDILLNEGQSPELLGRPAIYRNEMPGVCFTNTLIRFQGSSGLLPGYALLVYRYFMHSGRFTKAGTITTNIGHLSAGRFSQIEFPLCSTAEQKEIIGATDEKFISISRVAKEIDLQLIKAEKSKQSILASAFSGSMSK